MIVLRNLVASVLVAAVLILGAAWLPALWVDRHVMDRDGFLAIAEPLGEDPQLQRTMSDTAVDTLLDHDLVPGWIADEVRPHAQDAAAGLTETSAYRAMWSQTMQDLHGALLAPGDVGLDVDFAPAIDALIGPLEQNVPFSIPRPETADVTLTTVPDVPLLRHAATVTPYAWWAGPVALALLAAAIAIAAHRRILLAVAGIGLVAVGGLVALLASQIDLLMPRSVSQSDVVGPIVQVFQERFTADLLPQAAMLAGGGALLAAIGLLLIGLRRAA